jgi:hypothetical protein
MFLQNPHKIKIKKGVGGREEIDVYSFCSFFFLHASPS